MRDEGRERVICIDKLPLVHKSYINSSTVYTEKYLRKINTYVHTYLIGASLSEPHTSDTTYFRSVRLYIYIYVRRCPPKPPTHAHNLDMWF